MLDRVDDKTMLKLYTTVLLFEIQILEICQATSQI